MAQLYQKYFNDFNVLCLERRMNAIRSRAALGHRSTGTKTGLRGARLTDASGVIHSDDSQIVRNSSSSRHESRDCCECHTSRPPSA